MSRKTKHFIVLTVHFEQEQDGRWTAECKELGTATFGDTLEEANQSVREAIVLHLNGLEEVGERERFFKENNITVYPDPVGDEFRIEAPNDPRIFSQPFVHPVLQDA